MRHILRPMILRVSLCVVAVFAIIAASTFPVSPPATPNVQDPEALYRVLVAEDQRASTPSALKTLLEATESTDSAVRVTAVRALGRLERPGLLPALGAFSSSPAAAVRAAAVHAMAQSVLGQPGGDAFTKLAEMVSSERDENVLQAIGISVGRLKHASAQHLIQAESLLVVLGASSSTATLLGAARGFESLYRMNGELGASGSAAAVLRTLTRLPGGGTPGGDDNLPAQVRRMATAAIVASGGADSLFFESALRDENAEVRRVAVAGVANMSDPTQFRWVIRTALTDRAYQVRHQAVFVYGRIMRPTFGCGVLADAAHDANRHVAILAIDQMGDGCPPSETARVIDLLDEFADNDVGADDWHETSHAVLSLARLAPARAAGAVVGHSQHPVWPVRMYAARAAAEMSGTELLTTLAHDAHPNVREIALASLARLGGDISDSTMINALSTDDYQLLRTAASIAKDRGSSEGLFAALHEALDRITVQRKETSRDARVALLAAIGASADRQVATVLQRYTDDWDLELARLARAGLGNSDTGSVTTSLTRIASHAVPTVAELRELARVPYAVYIRNGQSFQIQLYPFEAPTNAGRFARLAASGYFDGLTFHRVVPNFVIQGGSPGANEFVGDGPFTRDELGPRSHWRGTVGVSTRGRDTGDAQIFVNLVDNPRLDHNYTIFGEVITGMDVVDDVMEGAAIDSVRVTR